MSCDHNDLEGMENVRVARDEHSACRGSPVAMETLRHVC